MSLPRIVSLEWGQIVVKIGQDQKVYKDCRIWPTGSDSWDWNRTGTRHFPGIQFMDFKDLLEKFPKTEVIILSKGMDNILHTSSETLISLEKIYPLINVYVLNTREAVDYYNQLSATKQIIGLFHSTC